MALYEPMAYVLPLQEMDDQMLGLPCKFVDGLDGLLVLF